MIRRYIEEEEKNNLQLYTVSSVSCSHGKMAVELFQDFSFCFDQSPVLEPGQYGVFTVKLVVLWTVGERVDYRKLVAVLNAGRIYCFV